MQMNSDSVFTRSIHLTTTGDSEKKLYYVRFYSTADFDIHGVGMRNRQIRGRSYT